MILSLARSNPRTCDACSWSRSEKVQKQE